MAEDVFCAVGRRKTSVARVRLSKGTGRLMVNDRALDAYCPQAEFAFLALRPLRKVGLTESVDLQIRVNGGGLMGQAGAISLGIARALLAMQPEVRAIIKPDGLFTRDPRMRERKKSGRPGARKRFQFSKR